MTRRPERTKTCCYPLCRKSSKQNEDGVSFFYFPKSSELRFQWTKRMNVPHLKPGRRTYVCSDHFTMDCFSMYPFADQSGMSEMEEKPSEFRRRLIRGSVPTLFKRSATGWVDGSENAEKTSSASSPCSACPLDACPSSFLSESVAQTRTPRFLLGEVPYDQEDQDLGPHAPCNGEWAANMQYHREDSGNGKKPLRDKKSGDLPMETDVNVLARKRRVNGENVEETLKDRKLQKEEVDKVECFPLHSSLSRYRHGIGATDHHLLTTSLDYSCHDADASAMDLSYPSLAAKAPQSDETQHTHAQGSSPNISMFKHLSTKLMASHPVCEDGEYSSPFQVLIPQYGSPCFPSYAYSSSPHGKDAAIVKIKQEVADDYDSDERHLDSLGPSPQRAHRVQHANDVYDDENIIFSKTLASIKNERPSSRPKFSTPPACIRAKSPNTFASSDASAPPFVISPAKTNSSDNDATALANLDQKQKPLHTTDSLSPHTSSSLSNGGENKIHVSATEEMKIVYVTSLAVSAKSSSEIIGSNVSRSVESQTLITNKTPSLQMVQDHGNNSRRVRPSLPARSSFKDSKPVSRSSKRQSGLLESKKSKKSGLLGLSKSHEEDDVQINQSAFSEDDDSMSVSDDTTNRNSAKKSAQAAAKARPPNGLPQPSAKTGFIKSRKNICLKNIGQVSFVCSDVSRPSTSSTLPCTSKVLAKNSTDLCKAISVPPAPIFLSPFPVTSLPLKNQIIAVLFSEGAETRMPLTLVSPAAPSKDGKRSAKRHTDKPGDTTIRELLKDSRKTRRDGNKSETSKSNLSSANLQTDLISGSSSAFSYGALVATNDGHKPVLHLPLDNTNAKPLGQVPSAIPSVAAQNHPRAAPDVSLKQQKSYKKTRADSSLKSTAFASSEPITVTHSSAEASQQVPSQSGACSVSLLSSGRLSNSKQQTLRWSSDTSVPASASSNIWPIQMSTSSPFHCSVSGMNKVSPAPSQAIPTTFSISSSFTQLEIEPHEFDQQPKEDLSLSPEHLEDFEEQPFHSKGLLTTVLIRQAHIVHDLFLVYKDNIDNITHINFILVDGSTHAKEGQEVKADGKLGSRISLKGLLSRFWKCCSELFFEGDEQKVPKTETSSAAAEDVPYQLGKILRHGLMACGYWPVILSIPCAVFILTGKRCSESLLHDCMRKVMFEFEVMALDDLQDAAAHEGTFAEGKGQAVHPFDVVKMEDRVSLVLRLYGGEHCKVPEKQEIGKFIKELASYYLHFRPYWWLREMRRGFLSLEHKDHMLFVVEAKVLELYHKLEPTPQAILKRTVFNLSTDKENQKKERRAKSYLERSLFRFTREDLSRLLLEWSEADCLLNEKYYVTFTTTKDDDTGAVLFHSESSTLVLATSWSSFDLFHSTLKRMIQGLSEGGHFV